MNIQFRVNLNCEGAKLLMDEAHLANLFKKRIEAIAADHSTGNLPAATVEIIHENKSQNTEGNFRRD